MGVDEVEGADEVEADGVSETVGEIGTLAGWVGLGDTTADALDPGATGDTETTGAT